MIRVRMKEAREGMVLARAVTGTEGASLMKEGAILTEAALARLREEGVDEVFVAPPPLTEQERDAKRRAVGNRAERMFRGMESDPVMQALKRSALEALLRKL